MESTVLTQVVMPLCLFIIMFGMGLSLVPADFSRVFVYPKAILLGLGGQLLLLPIVGFLIATFVISDPVLAIGLMLLAACPGGTTSNLITSLAKGDLALSISLTAFSSLFTIVTIPLIVGFSLVHFEHPGTTIEMPVLKTIATLFVITLLPVGFGMLVKHRFDRFALTWEPRIQTFSAVFLVLLVLMLVIQQKDTILGSIIAAGPGALLLNAATMLMGFAMARAASLNSNQTTSISIEVGVQNSALAILIATTLLNSAELAIPAAVYSLAMYLSGGLVILLRKYSNPGASLAVD